MYIQNKPSQAASFFMNFVCDIIVFNWIYFIIIASFSIDSNFQIMRKAIIVFCGILMVSVMSCDSGKYQVCEGFIQGTTFRIVYKNSENLNDTIFKMLQYFDNTLSTYQENSIISQINKNDKNVVLNELFIEFFNKSREVYEKSDGYFDITVAPLVQTWGFGPKEFIKSDSASIDSILNFVGMDKVKLENGKIIKSDPRIQLDGNAIAQGQSVDFIARMLEYEGTKNYMVEIGGEVRAKGQNDKGEIWKIGIDKPIEGSNEQNRELQTVILLANKSMATSGNYRKFHMVDGIKYSHTINPKTGYPAKDILLSASIIANECSIADGFATACMVLGFNKAKELLSGNKDLEAYFIYSGSKGELKVFMSPGFEKYLKK
jgi:FAD:protein FMN transferase